MLGPEGPGEAEQWVAGGRLAAALDAVDMAARVPGVDRIVLATSERQLANQYPQLDVQWDFDPAGQGFQFGSRLSGLLERYPAQAYIYLGAGSLPLIDSEVLAQAVQDVTRATQPLAITNNLYSSDWMAFNCPGAVRDRPERLETDNALGWVLKTEAGVEVRGQPPSAGTRLDIDTPADLLLLAHLVDHGPHLRRNLENYLRPAASQRDGSRWLAAGRRLFTAGGQVALIGRVSSAVWGHVEANTQAWIRVFSEERGMTASGRLAAGQVKSMVSAHLNRLGPTAFFDELSELAQAVFFDTRVVLAHSRRSPSTGDRYASDLGLVESIRDPWLRQFTAAALEAPIPIVLGGHGVVTGDLYGLVEVAHAGGLSGSETETAR